MSVSVLPGMVTPKNINALTTHMHYSHSVYTTTITKSYHDFLTELNFPVTNTRCIVLPYSQHGKRIPAVYSSKSAM